MSAAHDFRKERRVSGAHQNDERTKGLFLPYLALFFLNYPTYYESTCLPSPPHNYTQNIIKKIGAKPTPR